MNIFVFDHLAIYFINNKDIAKNKMHADYSKVLSGKNKTHAAFFLKTHMVTFICIYIYNQCWQIPFRSMIFLLINYLMSLFLKPVFQF